MTSVTHSTPASSPARKPAQAALPRSTNTYEASRPLAGMLLAAGMAAMLVIADQVIDSWTDGHILAAWVALWTVTFAALAFLATPLRRMANAGARWLAARRRARAARRQDERMWELAGKDQRVMADIRMASLRQTQGH